MLAIQGQTTQNDTGIGRVMQDETRKNYEAKAQDLRAQLKLFEGDWAKNNGGKKPDRNAIKQNPDIGKSKPNYPTFFPTPPAHLAPP